MLKISKPLGVQKVSEYYKVEYGSADQAYYADGKHLVGEWHVLIKFIENAPDTVLTLTSGEKIIVRESTDQVVEGIVAFRRAVLKGLLSVGQDPNSATAAMTRREIHNHTDHPAEGSHRG